MIRWKKPSGKQLKLNVDGASKGNPRLAGGGGILRDSNGTYWAGFSHHYGSCTNMVAETRALLDGLSMCKDLGLRDIVIEIDSKVLFQWVKKGACSLWWLWKYWKDIMELIRLTNAQIHHVF